MAAGMDHVVEALDGLGDRRRGRARPRPRAGDAPSSARQRRCAFTKFLAYGWSSQRSLPSVRDQVDAARGVGQAHGLGRAASPASASTSTTSGTRADVEIEGDGELQQAVRFALFHTLQAGARAERRAIPAKGLTGPGYDGHVFWDTETLRAAGAHLHARRTRPPTRCSWRHATLDLARERAAQLGLEGAAFPWRTIRGQECSRLLAGRHRRRSTSTPTSPTPSSATCARPATRSSRRGPGLELLVETARLWRSLGHHDHDGALPHRRRHRPGRVLGDRRRQRLHEPDGRAEPAQRRRARRAPSRTRRARSASTTRRSRPGATPPRRCTSRTTSGCSVHPQDAGFTRHALLDFERPRVPAAAARPVLPALPHAGGQAARPRARAAACAATASRAEEKARDFAYYEAITVRDSLAVGVRRRPSSPPRSAISSWPTTTSARPR